MLDICFPKRAVYCLSDNMRRMFNPHTSTFRVENNTGHASRKNCVWVLLPSKWACINIIAYPYYQEMFCLRNTGKHDRLSFEDSPLSHRRMSCNLPIPSLWVRQRGAYFPISVSSYVSFHLQSQSPNFRTTMNEMAWCSKVAEQGGTVGSCECALIGTMW